MTTKVDKPWGHEVIWAHTDRYAGKILVIDGNQRLSLQTHRTKSESVYVLEGVLVIEIERDGELETRQLFEGQSLDIPAGTCHRFSAIQGCRILEVSTPELDDVVRHEDDYGRCAAK